LRKSTYNLFLNPIRLLLLTMLVFALTLGTGQMAQASAGQAPVNLGGAAPFVILSESGITNVPTSIIRGNMGVSPIAATAITGFALVADKTNTFSTSSQVTGKIYAADYASPTPAGMTTAISDMQAAYNDAAGRKLPNYTERYGGNLSARTLVSGLYKWSTGVVIYKNVYLSGGANSVWIFQIAGNLKLGSGVKVILENGARAKNVFWQVGGGAGAEIGTTAHVEGTILAKTAIHLRTGASLNGRALAQTAVTLDKNKVVLH
jgi:Ice-binding-like